ncbi:MAG: hypothetical protein RL662_986 [Bacteroidota bacterium]|jgi:YD repeat-containing protein
MKKLLVIATILGSMFALGSCSDDDNNITTSEVKKLVVKADYSAVDQDIENFEYNNKNQLVTYTVSQKVDGVYKLEYKYSLTYDANNKLVQVYNEDTSGNTAYYYTTTYTHHTDYILREKIQNNNPNSVKMVDSLFIDSAQRVIKKVNTNGNRTSYEYEYDANDNLIKETIVHSLTESDINEYKYDNKKSMYSNIVNLPKWFVDTEYILTQGFAGKNNAIELIEDGVTDVKVAYEYDADGYPVKVINAETNKTMATITYKVID